MVIVYIGFKHFSIHSLISFTYFCMWAAYVWRCSMCVHIIYVYVCVRERHTEGCVWESQLSFSSSLHLIVEAGSFTDHWLCLLTYMLEGFACPCPHPTLGLQPARDLNSGPLAYVVSISPITSHLHSKTMSYIFSSHRICNYWESCSLLPINHDPRRRLKFTCWINTFKKMKIKGKPSVP